MVGDFPFKIDKSIARDPKKVLEVSGQKTWKFLLGILNSSTTPKLVKLFIVTLAQFLYAIPFLPTSDRFFINLRTYSCLKLS